ncbi:hypothetical protein INR49_005733 [Caranx melampygus]|nr:hypothetical protein INR49_005733 [Caranx melampygus]
MEAAPSGLISITYLRCVHPHTDRTAGGQQLFKYRVAAAELSQTKPDQRSRAAETTVTLRPLDVNSRRVVTVWKRPDDAGGWTEWRSGQSPAVLDVSFDECEV